MGHIERSLTLTAQSAAPGGLAHLVGFATVVRAGWGTWFIGGLTIIGSGCGDPPADPPIVEQSTGIVESSSSAGDSTGEPVAPGMPQSLVMQDRWELTPTADDPFPDERPQWTGCELGWDVETGLFEVDTELCLYGSFTQTTLTRINEGDTVELVLLHDALWAEEEAVAHVAIAFGDEIAWETELAIPAEPAQLRPTWTAAHDVAASTPMHFHIHNHGNNNYRFVALTVQATP